MINFIKKIIPSAIAVAIAFASAIILACVMDARF